jgi:hypothetical protein
MGQSARVVVIDVEGSMCLGYMNDILMRAMVLFYSWRELGNLRIPSECFHRDF